MGAVAWLEHFGCIIPSNKRKFSGKIRDRFCRVLKKPAFI
jgi:hypothetical protein